MRILRFLLPFPTSCSSTFLSSFITLYGNVSCVGAPCGGIERPCCVCWWCWSSTSTGPFGQQASQTRKQVHILQKPLYISQFLQQSPNVRLRQKSRRAGLQVKLDGKKGGNGQITWWLQQTYEKGPCFQMSVHIFTQTKDWSCLKTQLQSAPDPLLM